MAEMQSMSPQVEFALWLVRYLGTGALFLLGLKAPGLPKRPYMLLINEDERDMEHGQVILAVSGRTPSHRFKVCSLYIHYSIDAPEIVYL